MTVAPFDERPPSQRSPVAQSESPEWRPHGDDRRERAVIELLEHGVLSHAIGRHGEYKVRTTLVTRQAWQYRCCVLRQGKAIKGAFFPIVVERTPPLRQARPKPWNAEDWRLNLAQEAVDVHFTRCAALQEYLVLSAIYDQPPSQSRRWYILLLAPLIGIAFAVAYGIWAHAFRTESGQPPGSLPSAVAERPPTTRSVPPPTPSGTASRNSIHEIHEKAGASSPTDLLETPKAVSVKDLIALQGPSQKVDRGPGALTPQASPGSAVSDIQPGDVLHLTGWLHRVSRAPDNTYRLHMSPNRNAGARDLIAMVPPPESAPGSPDVKVQLQTVRTFVKQQLLRQQEPSPRGSVMQRPIFVQLIGQLSYPTPPRGAPARGKRAQEPTARWEVRPVLEVRFATPSEPPNRSQSW